MAKTYQPGDEPVPGTGYRLTEFLGRGGFGEVWKASAPGGAEAALKIIRLGGTEGRKEFRALQLVKRIRHPNLVPIIAFWLKTEDGSVLDDKFSADEGLVAGDTDADNILKETMAVPTGGSALRAKELVIAMGLGDATLFDRLQQCQAENLPGIPREELLRYMDDVAEAIDYLNSPIHDLAAEGAAIQHCDIKPQNLMIVGGAAQVCDFGLARMIGADRTTTAAASIAYAAPECLEVGQPSSSTDQYSLAISYFELRTGRLPYVDNTLAAVMQAKRQGDLDFSKLPQKEAEVLHRATSHAPEQRYASCVELVTALRETEAKTVDVVRKTIQRPSAERPSNRVRPWAIMVMLAGLALVVWGLWYRFGDDWFARRPPQPNVDRPKDDPVEAPKENGEDPGNGPTVVDPVDPPGDNGPTERVPTIAEADALMQRGAYDDAVTAYGRVIDIGPTQSVLRDAYFGRGHCRLQLQDYDQAIVDFEAALELDPPEPLSEAWQNDLAMVFGERGWLALQESEYDRAIEDLERAAKYDPRNNLIFVRLAGAWFAMGNDREAVNNLTTALNIKETYMDYTSRGVAYLGLEDYIDEAIDDFTDAIRLNGESAAAHAHRGDALMARFGESLDRQDIDDALADLDRAIELCEGDPDANFSPGVARAYRSACHLLAGDVDKAAEDCTALVAMDPMDRPVGAHTFFRELAGAFATKGQFTEAVEWIDHAIEAAPDDETRGNYESRRTEYQDQ